MTLYSEVSLECSKLLTRRYSTSFSMGIRCFAPHYRPPIYALYGFVRLADEIVDTFTSTFQSSMFNKFESDTWLALEEGISSNPILHSFQQLVSDYRIDHDLIQAFLHSMRMDLEQKIHTIDSYKTYIYGSAEVVGVMCLRIFYKDSDTEYLRLKPYARKLGEAFQKINFLRDLGDDYFSKGRIYFPNLDPQHFTNQIKVELLDDINADFEEAQHGIVELKKDVRIGVQLAFNYYFELSRKIAQASADKLLQTRYSVSNWKKLMILGKTLLQQAVV